MVQFSQRIASMAGVGASDRSIIRVVSTPEWLMVRLLDSDDFRARREVLESDDFASADGEPDPPPSALISEETWDGIMTLPDDVAIRTTSHLGEWVELLHDLWRDG